MKIFLTEIEAIDPNDGTLKKWSGERVIAESIEAAQLWCNSNEKGYLKIVGELVEEKENRYDADFNDIWQNIINQ